MKTKIPHSHFFSVKHTAGGIAGGVTTLGLTASSIVFIALHMASVPVAGVTLGLINLMPLTHPLCAGSIALTKGAMKGTINEFKKAQNPSHRGFWKTIKDEKVGEAMEKAYVAEKDGFTDCA